MTPAARPVPASVIVVSRHRAEALRLCLTALGQQDHPEFEVIVVADPAGIAAAQATGLPLRLVAFDEANISAARNAGLALAGAPVVAFIDDDACAEPTWLSRLTAPFADAAVGAATGFVRGRNGISFQWQASEVDSLAQDHPLQVPQGPSFHAGSPSRAVKTQGTNCAFRRDVLAAAGGFDPAFRFYLDEVDVNLRAQAVTAVVPLAQVVHGFAESARRRADRVPLSLHDIGASCPCLWRRHMPGGNIAAEVARLLAAQADRLQALSGAGRIGAEAAARLMQSLRDGLDEGGQRPIPLPPPIAAASGFAPLPGTGPRAGRLIAGRVWQRRRLIEAARQAVAAGEVVTVLCLSPTARPHWHRLHPDGFWLQEGGLFGRALRQGPRLRLWTFARRVAAERARLAGCRPLDHGETAEIG